MTSRSPIAILVVADDPRARPALERSLSAGISSAEVRLESAGRLSDALERLGRGGIDLVLVDLLLPDSKGLGTLHRLQSAAPHLPVIVMTEDLSGALEAVRAGAQDTLVNGHSGPDVMLRVAGAIERQRLLTELRRRDVAKEQFVADAAHELRRPITTLTWHARILAEQFADLNPEEKKVCLHAVRQESSFVLNLIDDLLDLCRFRLGSLPAELTPLPLDEVVRRVVEREPVPEDRRIRVDVGPECVVLAEARRLGQILANLLSNAVRYGGRSISIEGYRQGTHVVLAVEDDGPGIPPEFAASLFQPFARAAGTDSIPGAGLGLALSRRLARALGGDLVHAPSSRRSGIRFEISLPAAGSVSGEAGRQSEASFGERRPGRRERVGRRWRRDRR